MMIIHGREVQSAPPNSDKRSAERKRDHSKFRVASSLTALLNVLGCLRTAQA